MARKSESTAQVPNTSSTGGVLGRESARPRGKCMPGAMGMSAGLGQREVNEVHLREPHAPATGCRSEVVVLAAAVPRGRVVRLVALRNDVEGHAVGLTRGSGARAPSNPQCQLAA